MFREKNWYLKQKRGVYKVTWTEKHSIEVEAYNQDEAIEKAKLIDPYTSYSSSYGEDVELVSEVA